MVITNDMKADGWLEHDGSCCPAPGRGTIDVMLRGGAQTYSRFGFWLWARCRHCDLDIVAWRPDDPEQMELAA